MKKVFISLLLLATFFPLYPGPAMAQTQPGVLLVKLRDSADLAKLQGLSSKAEPLFDDIYRIEVADAPSALAALRASPWVDFAETDGVVKSAVNAADPLFVLDEKAITKQWYLPKMSVHLAWQQSVGTGITIAIVDTGIDAKHEDLNDGRVIGGYASYCQAQNLADPANCLIRVNGALAPGVNSDDNGHGTIVAGIIGAIANNSLGIAGINWNVKLMPIKALDASGTGLASDVAVGIKWAADHGAKIINLSIGGEGLQGIGVLQDAITYAFNKGVLIVAAAGNDAAATGGNLNIDPVLPVCADGGQNMVVGVAATDINDRKAVFSNYGSNCIDISAPGAGTFVDKQNKQGLVSTYFDPTRPGEQDLYVYAVGTSVAAPMVSGVAGLMESIFPDLDVKAIRDRLIGSVDNIDLANQDACNGTTCAGQIGKGRLNALKAVSVVSTFSSGTLVRSAAGQIYLIDQGLKRPVSAFVLVQRFANSSVVNASDNDLSVYPLGTAVPPADGITVKQDNDPTVYLLQGGTREALSYVAFVSRGWSFVNVTTLSAADLNAIPRGPDASVLNGVLMKAPDQPAVYILNNGVRELMSYFVFQQRQFQSLPLAILTSDVLAVYPLQAKGYLYPPIDGTLIRGDEVATVYLIDGGKRRGLSLVAFQSRGYRFADVHVLPQSEVNGYESGLDILN